MISLLKILDENQIEIEVKNPNYYQQLVDQTNFSPKEKKYYTSLINAIKNKGNRATPNQYHTLQQIKKGKVNEGAKVTFKDADADYPKIVDNIEVSISPIEGEQLSTINGDIKKEYKYNVFYSLETTKAPIKYKKPAADALKYQSKYINHNDLKALVTNTLKQGGPNKIDYIAYLESEGSLNKDLADIIAEIYNVSSDNIVKIDKTQYEKLDDAVDWEEFNKLSDKVKQTIIRWLYKTTQPDRLGLKTPPEEPPFTIRKSGELQSILIKALHSKYNLGLHPYITNKQAPYIYNIILKCITQGKKLIIIDDNYHQGTDFSKIFQSIEGLIDKLKVENRKLSGKLGEEIKRLGQEVDDIANHPKFETSDFLKQKYKKKFDEYVELRKPFDITANALDIEYASVSNRIYGYVLYRLPALNKDLE